MRAQQELPPELFRTSTHHLGLAEAVELARTLGRLPQRLVVYGVEGASFEIGDKLTAEVRNGSEQAAAAIREEVPRMHEQALMNDLMRRIEAEAAAGGAHRVTRIRVALGALSHFSPEHFREHFEDSSRGTVAEGAAVEAEVRTDPTEPDAQGVVLESIDIEVG